MVSLKKVNMDPNARLSFTERFAYGTGDFAGNIVYSAISVFLVFYYTDVIGLSGAIIGTIMLVSRLLDGVSDLVMGVIVDRTKSKHGKARVWILRLCIPYAISGVILFSVPTSMSEFIQYVYVFLSYNLATSVIFTAINVPYATMNALMTQNQYERGLLGIFRMLLATAGTLFINTFTLKVVKLLGNTPAAWSMTFLIFGSLSIVVFLFTFYFTKERIVDEPTEEKDDVPVIEGFKALFKNKYWLIMTFAVIAMYFSLTLYGGASVYFAKVIMGNEDKVALLGNTITIAQIATMFLTAFFMKRYGKRNVYAAGALITVVGYALVGIFPDSLAVIVSGNIIKGIGMGCAASCMWGMLSDTIEYGEWKTGIRTAGLINAASSFGNKIGTGLGGAVLGWLISASGYDGSATEQSATAVFAINSAYNFIPLVLTLITFILLLFYKLDKEYPQIVDELNERKSQTE